MAKRKNLNDTDKAVELLEKLLATQLYSMGVPQTRIATMVKKSTTWVNDLLKGVPQSRRSK